MIHHNYKKYILILVISVILSFTGIFIFFQSKINGGTVEVKQLNDHVWLLNESNQATGYLVVGNEKAAVIDTMNGYQNLNKTVQKITNLPVIVLNTHGHSDHVWGDGYFGEAYLNKDDQEIGYNSFNNILYRFIEWEKHLKKVRFTDMSDGDIFDLGGITLMVYRLPGHTPGGICILDTQDRILFTGDSINRHCWMQLQESLSITDFCDNLEALSVIRDQYDTICHGHAKDFEDAILYDQLLEAAKDLRDGNTTNDSPYKYWGGTCKQHPFPSGNGVIVY